LLRMIVKSADMLRKYPTIPLATGVVEVDPVASLPVRTFLDIANASVQPPVIPGNVLAFECMHAKSIYACSGAERFMLDTLKIMQDREFSSGSQNPDVIVDDANKPVFIRKAIGELSALSLAPVSINGIPYPAGSIMRLETKGRQDNVGKIGSVGVRSVDQVTSISFRRLSAFALPADITEYYFPRKAVYNGLRMLPFSPSQLVTDFYNAAEALVVKKPSWSARLGRVFGKPIGY
jgi:hypothetical protein